MKNFEYYSEYIAEAIYDCKKGDDIDCDYCKQKEMCDQLYSVEQIKKWFFEEYKEPIKLTQFEYDIINYHGKLSKFNDICILMAMKNKGHFKDMNSVEKCSMTIEEILENCEVVENVD